MANKKDWREEYKEKNPQEESEKSNWRDKYKEYYDYNSAKIVGEKVTNMLDAWQKNYNSYVTDYTNRFSGRTGSYEDAYVGDSLDWLNAESEKRAALRQQEDDILAYLNQYGGHLDSKWVKQVFDTIEQAKDAQYKIHTGATQDNEYWNSFGTEDMLEKYGSAQGAYEYYQRTNQYNNKYSGLSFEDLNWAAGILEDGEEKEWLTSYAASVAYDEKSKYDVAAGEAEIKEMEDYALWAINELRPYSGYAAEYNKQAEKLFGKYGVSNAQEMKDLIEEKKRYIADSTRIQNNIAMSSVSDPTSKYYDPSFKNYTDTSNIALLDIMKNFGGYKYMNSKERDTFAYYYNKYGSEKANEYLDSIAETLNYRKAERNFAKYKDQVFLEEVFAIEAGLDQAYTGLKNLFSDKDYIPTSSKQYLSGMIREDLKDDGFKLPDWMGGASGGQIVYDLLNTSANMAPSMLVGAAANVVVPGSGALVGAAMMGGSAAGNAYQEALNLGYDKGQARMYSTLVGASEAGLQYLMGGIGKLGGKLSGKAATTLASKFNSAYARLAVQYGTNMLSEGTEEYLQEILTPVFKNLAFGTDEEIELITEEAIYSFLLGALTSGMGEITGITSNTGKSLPGHLIEMSALNKQNKQAAEMYGDATADLVKEGLESDSESEAHELAEMFKRKLDKGKKMSGYEIRQQIAANDDIARINNKLDATHEAAKRLKELGETSDVGKIASLVAKNAMGQKLTSEEKSALVRSEYGSQVAKEMRDAVAQAENTAYKPLEDRVEDETPAKVSDTGKAVISGTNQQVDLTAPKIKKITADSVILEVDGNDVDMDSIEFANEDQWNMFNAIKKIEHITPAVASDMIAKVDTSKPIWNQLNGMDEAFTYGYWNYSEADLDSGLFATYLTNKQQNDAYKLGQYVRKNEVKVDETNRKKMRTAFEAKMSKKEQAAQQKARIESDDVDVYFMDGETVEKFGDREGYNEKRMAAVNTAKFLRKLGIGGKFVFYESYEKNGKRYFKDKNGVERSAPNGFYDPADGSIYIDLNAGNDGSGKALFTMGHELAHFVKHRSEKQFKILSDMVAEAFDKTSLSMHKRVLRKQAFLQGIRGNTEKVSYSEAYEEVVADAMSTMLTDGSFYDTLMEIKVKHKDLFATIKKFFTDMIAKFKQEYANIDPDQQDARDIRALKDAFDKIQKAFAEGLVEASENFQAEQTQKNTTEEGGVKLMSRDQNQNVIVDENVDSQSVRKVLTAIFNGNYKSNNNYFPVLKHTPEVYKTYCHLDADRSFVMARKKAYKAMHKHALGVDGLMYVIENLATPDYIVYQTVGEYAGNYAAIIISEEREIFAAVQLGEYKDAQYAPAGEKGYYNTLITAFYPNEGYLDDNIFIPENDVVYDKNEDPLQVASGVTPSDRAERSSANNIRNDSEFVKNKSVEAMDVEVDAKTESVAPTVLKSERTWTSSDYVQERDKAAKEIAKAIGVTEQKAKDYIDSINSIAKMIADDRSRLDYFSSPGRSSFIGNVEYGGSFDFSTLCKKRRLLTGTFTAIQKALPNTALTADEILDIRNRMKEANLEVSCGLCYVEGSRANMGQFAKEFLRLYKQYYPDAWQPNMADVNTPDGIEWVRINHPECYEQYEYFWNHYGTLKEGDKNLFASQQKPKLYQLHTEYKGEILEKFKDDDNVEEKNLNGGIRLQSFSDFEIVHLIDTMQIIMDMSRVGLAGQAYTKVPDFAWALGDTGLKINLSLIAKGVDENGKLIFDDVEGMPIADAMKLRDRYSKNVGTILVAFNDEQLLAAMADERVDFIIPFHRSQWKKSQYEAMGLPAKTKDYTFMQNEKYIKPQFHEYRGRMVKDKATNYMPNEYWDFSKSGKENAEAYLEMCARNNKRPKFYKLLQNNGDGSYSLKADGSTDGYWKLLIDFKMYDNEGTGSPQMAVKPEFNMDEANRMLNDYKGGHSNFPVAQGIVDGFVKDYKASHKGQKFSERDTVKQDRAYLDAVNRGDMETAKKMADEAAKEAGFPVRLLHGTQKFGFTVVDTSLSDDKLSFFATSDVDTAKTYSSLGGKRGISENADYDSIDEESASHEKNARDMASRLADKISRWAGYYGYVNGDYIYDKFRDIADDYERGRISQEEADQQMYELADDLIANGYNKDSYDGLEFWEWQEEHEEAEELYTEVNKTISAYFALTDFNSHAYTSGNYDLYANTDGLLVIEGNGAKWNDIKSDILPDITSEDYKKYGYRGHWDKWTTRSISKYAYDNGYRGVLFKNIYDDGGKSSSGVRKPADVYSFFYPKEQVKSADPVTYDDNGNVIPLSERFNQDTSDIRYSYRGVNKDGIEVYETSDETKKLPYTERQKQFLDIMTNEYRGRTAKFVRNGHAYYATFEEKDVNKNIYGDKLSDKKGWKAKINVGADGDIFELVENSQYNGSLPEKGKKNTAHRGVGYWDYFIKNVQIDGTVFDLVANVRKKADGAFVYSIQLKENKKIKASPPRGSLLRALSGVTDASKTTVSQPDPNVKTNNTPKSERGEDSSNRSLLANAFEGITRDSIEYKMIQEYKGHIKNLNALEKNLGKLNEEIRKIYRTPGKRDTARLKKLTSMAEEISNEITRHDRELLSLEASEPLRKVLQRERKKEAQKTKEHIAEIQQNKKVRAEQTEYRYKIRNFKKKLETKLLRPTDRQYVPVDLIKAMVEVCNIIDTDTDLYKADGSINKAQVKRDETKEKLSNLKDAYENLQNHSDPIYAGEFDDVVYEYLKELREKFSNKSLVEMSRDELSEMYEILVAIDETLADARKLIGWGDAESVYEAGDSIVAEQDAITKKRKNGKRNAVQKAFDQMNNLGLSPVRNVEKMSGYNQDSALLKLFKKFEQGVRKKNKFVMDAYKNFEQLNSGKEYDDAVYKEVEGKKYTDVNGREFGVSKMQMMQAILSYERETANKMNHISSSGFSFADLNKLNKGKLKDAISEEYSHRVPAAVEMVAEFQKILKDDKWCQAYMDAARRFFNEDAKNAINETSIALKHRIIAKEKNYIPFEVDKNFVVREISAENDIQQTINSYGMMKDTKKGASQPIIITGLNNILDRHIDQVGNVYGLAIDVRNFNKVWNVKAMDTDNNNPTVKTAIQRNWGVGGAKNIEQTVQDIQGPRMRDRSWLYDKVKSGYIGSTFLLNLSVVTKQNGSLFSATSMIKWRDPVRMLANLYWTMINSKKIAAEVDKYTATAWMRRQGLSDAEVYTLVTERKKSKLGRLLSNAPAIINPSKWITARDHAVALSLWKYCKQDVAKKTGLKGEELLKATAEFYDDVVENTQSMTDVLHRPEIQKSGKLLHESFAMFKTDLYQMAGQLQTTAGRFLTNKNAENGKALARTVYAITMSALWGSLMTTVFALLRYKVNPYRDDDDELTEESWLKRQGAGLMGDMMGYILPIFGSEVVGAFENIMYGERDDVVDNIVLTAVNDLYSAMITVGTSIKDGEWPEVSDMKKLAAKALQVFGIPANNILRTWDAIQLHAEDIANGEFFSFNAGVEDKTKKLYNAIVRGDKVEIANLKSTYVDKDGNFSQSKYDSAVVKALRENDPRIKAAAQANVNGNAGERNRIKDEIKAELGTDYANYIILAINAETSAIRNEGKPDKVAGQYGAYDFVEAVSAGDANTAKAVREDIISTYKANGKTQTEAEKAFVSDVKTGIEEAYSYGDISKDVANDMLIDYADMEADDAADKITIWDFLNANPDSNLSDSKVLGYLEFAESAGVSLEMFEQVVNDTKGIKNIKDKWGEVEVTEREQILEVIDSLPIGWKQKDAIYLAYGLPEDRIWDVPW